VSVTVQLAAVYVSAGTRNELRVNASVSLSERTLPCALAAQLAQLTAEVESAVAVATERAPCNVPVDASAQVIAKALGAIEFVDVALLIAAPVTERLVTVLRDERTLPVTPAELVQGAVVESVLVTLHVTVPLVTVIVARTGAVRFAAIVPVVAACAAIGALRTAAIIALATVRNKRFIIRCLLFYWIGRWFAVDTALISGSRIIPRLKFERGFVITI
jgi:hypothetical protein